MMMPSLLIPVLAAALAPLAGAAVLTGTITKAGVTVLGFFCYDVDPSGASVGTVRGTIQSLGGNTAAPTLVLLDDHMSSYWHAMLDVDCGCECASEIATSLAVTANGSAVPFSTAVTETTRPRFVMPTVISCSAGAPNVEYSIKMLTADGSQVGVSMRGLDAMFITMWMLCLGAVLYYLWVHRAAGFLGVVWPEAPLQRWLFWSAVLWWAACMFAMIHYSNFASNGHGVPHLLGLSAAVGLIAHLLLLRLMLALATGFLVSNDGANERSLNIAFGALLVALLVCIAAYFGTAPPFAFLLGASGPAMVVLALLHIAVAVWFVARLTRTFGPETEGRKRRFYKRFGIIGGLWLFRVPFMMLLSWSVPDYMERVLVVSVDTVFSVLTYGFLFSVFSNVGMTSFLRGHATMGAGGATGGMGAGSDGGDLYKPLTADAAETSL